ncbi:MAG: hypothetical protein Q8R83_10170 [Legionellaceae bacterium]|nr:hypothetical protein [Legionellaceae bacterium]
MQYLDKACNSFSVKQNPVGLWGLMSATIAGGEAAIFTIKSLNENVSCLYSPN